SPALGDGDAGCDIRVEEEFLHRGRIRIKNTDELAEIRIYPVQPTGQRRVRRRSYHAAAHKALFAPLRIYHAETNRGHAGVYAQNSQTYAPLSNTFYHGAALKSSRAARRRARPSSQPSG